MDFDITDRDRIERLEAATERLSQNVVGLSTALALVTEISKRQSDLENRTSQVASSKVDKIVFSQQLVTMEDIRREAARAWAISAVIVVCILAIAIGYTRYKSVQQIHDRLRASHVACVQNNQRTEVQVKVLQGIAAADTASSRAVINAQILKGATEMASLNTNCDHLFPLPR